MTPVEARWIRPTNHCLYSTTSVLKRDCHEGVILVMSVDSSLDLQLLVRECHMQVAQVRSAPVMVTCRLCRRDVFQVLWDSPSTSVPHRKHHYTNPGFPGSLISLHLRVANARFCVRVCPVVLISWYLDVKPRHHCIA